MTWRRHRRPSISGAASLRCMAQNMMLDTAEWPDSATGLDFKIRKWSHIPTYLVLFVLVGTPSSKKPKATSFLVGSGWDSARLFLTSIDGMTGSNFWFDVILSRLRSWRHFTQKSAATWWVDTTRLPGACAAAYASFCSIVGLQGYLFVFRCYCVVHRCRNFMGALFVFTARQHSLLCRALY